MSDYAPPSGPPPPKVPEGWKAVWNDQYKEWFYVNLHTKQSSWDKPTAPATAGGDDVGAPGGPPPSYSEGPGAPRVSDSKTQPPPTSLSSNNPYQDQLKAETDEQMARRLQAEEDARHQAGGANRGQADDYYGGPNTNQGSSLTPNQQELPPRPTSGGGGDRGLFGKLKSKLGGSSSGGYPQQPQGYGGGPYTQQYGGPPQGYGGYPPQQQGYGPPQGYGGGYGGGYGPPQGYGQPMYAQQPQRKKPGGLGVGGAAALGVGGGLLGGMLLEDAIHDGGDGGDGGDYGGDGGGDYGGDGGGDFGGGDF